MSANLKLVRNSTASIEALAEVSLAIMRERDKTERQIKILLEAGKDRDALQLMKKHLGVRPRLKKVK